MKKIFVLNSVFLILFGLAVIHGQESEQPLRVATRLVKPFVFEENGKLVGFSIELWQRISNHMKVKSEFVIKPTVADLLSAIKSKEADVGIAAISITAERDKNFDFSHPMFDAGLQILVKEQAGSGSIANLVSDFFTTTFFPLGAIVLAVLLIPAHIVWFFERRHHTGLISTPSYFPGIFEACWWAAATLATQADQMPKSVVGRMVAVMWMFAAVVFIAYFTAAVTSSLTVQRLREEIKGPEDLPGKRVASVTGSTSVQFLRQQNIEVADFKQIEEAYKALLDGQADAVVYDAPVLLYHVSHEGRGKVQVVGPIFRMESYGSVYLGFSSFPPTGVM
jgi:polar amino acid transport system substrate-binding protein